jgi:hypothetical protein
MRKWGIIISVFYAVVVVVLLIPAGILLAGNQNSLHEVFSNEWPEMFGEWLTWVWIFAVLAAQALLLFLSVDTSQQRFKSRTHLAISVIVSSMLVALLVFAGVSALGAAVYHDQFIDKFWVTAGQVLAIWVALWVAWAILFYLYFRSSTTNAAHIVSWLLKGSVLELLIAVPCHVWVRRRGDCSAPIATSFGIVTGIAIMLLAFGPSVLLLYKKRLDAYSQHGAK